MTISCGRNTVAFLSIPLVVRSTAGVPVAADSLPIASFFRSDPNSGAVVLDIAVGTSGTITATAVTGQTGVYTAAVEVATMEHPQYHVVWNYAVSSSARREIVDVLFLPELDVLSANDESLAGGMAFASRGVVIP